MRSVSVRTLAGEVELKQVTAKNVEGSTKAGEVNFKKVLGKVTAKTTSGEINIQDHDSKYNLEASSTARRYRYYFIGKTTRCGNYWAKCCWRCNNF